MKQSAKSSEKAKSSVYVDSDLIRWIDKKVEEKVFGSRNHAIEVAIILLKARIELIEQFLKDIDEVNLKALQRFISELEKQE